MAKKQKPDRPARVPYHLQGARDALCRAMFDDEDLGKFVHTFQDGHKMTLEEVHTWIIAAQKHFEQNGPRFAALKAVNSALQDQRSSGN